MNAGSEWPRRSLTTFTGTPSLSRIVACVWRRSWRRMRGTSVPARPSESRRDNVGVVVRPVLLGEDVVRSGVALTEGEALLVLAAAVPPQESGGVGIEVHGSGLVALWGVLDDLALRADQGASHAEAVRIEVNVGPSKTQELATAHPRAASG